MVTEKGESPVGEPSPEAAERPRRRKPERENVDRSVTTRWGSARLGNQFTPVSAHFLEHYHRLAPFEKGAAGLSSTEAMLIIHLMSFKWDVEAPYPTLKTLATRMGLSPRQIRSTLSRLEALGMLRREPAPKSPVGANAYNLSPLFERLEALLDADERREERKRSQEVVS